MSERGLYVLSVAKRIEEAIAELERCKRELQLLGFGGNTDVLDRAIYPMVHAREFVDGVRREVFDAAFKRDRDR